MTPALLALALTAAPAPPVKPELAGVAFLVGDWTSGRGEVAETGGSARGLSHVTVEAGGAALLRRDHTDLADATGKPMGGFDQIMLVYPEDGTLHADYSDGSHVIHYVGATIDPGRSVVFTTAARPDAPTFRLGYTLAGATLSVAFAMAPPGAGAFRPIAVGTLTRAASRTAP